MYFQQSPTFSHRPTSKREHTNLGSTLHCRKLVSYIRFLRLFRPFLRFRLNSGLFCSLHVTSGTLLTYAGLLQCRVSVGLAAWLCHQAATQCAMRKTSNTMCDEKDPRSLACGTQRNALITEDTMVLCWSNAECCPDADTHHCRDRPQILSRRVLVGLAILVQLPIRDELLLPLCKRPQTPPEHELGCIRCTASQRMQCMGGSNQTPSNQCRLPAPGHQGASKAAATVGMRPLGRWTCGYAACGPGGHRKHGVQRPRRAARMSLDARDMEAHVQPSHLHSISRGRSIMQRHW
jgi:hypothetical protein